MPSSFDSHSSGAVDPDLFAGEIRLHLEQMIASPAFGRSERPARFLRYLVEAVLAGQTHTLKESVIGSEVFGRVADWDPRLDPIVRQEAARLRKRIAQYYESAKTAALRIELPVGGYVPIFIREVLPETVSAAELDSVNVAEPAAPASSRKWVSLYVGLGVTFALLAILALFWHPGVWRGRIKIAVVPFVNSTGDQADQYFVDGLGSDFADILGRFKNVSVVPRSEFLRLRGQGNPDWRQIAPRHGATHMLEGAVERRADRVNFVVSLLDCANGKTLWTNTYRRSTADINAMEASVTTSLGAALNLVPASGRPMTPPSPESHDAYLKGMYELNRGTVESNDAAQVELRRAIELNPQYAQAYTGLAQAIWNRNIAAGTRPIMEERRKAEELWEKALEIDPGYTPARSGLAYFAMQYDWDFKRAESELKIVLRAGENAAAEENYAALCLILGRREEANKHIDYARQIAPNEPNRMVNQINMLGLSLRYTEAEEACRRLMLLVPKSTGPKLTMASIWSDEGKPKQALELLASLPQDRPSVQIAEAKVYAQSGDYGAALRLLHPIEQAIESNGIFYYDLAVAYAAMGDAPNAVRWMQRSMNAREGPALYIREDPELARVQRDPGYVMLKKRMGLDW